MQGSAQFLAKLKYFQQSQTPFKAKFDAKFDAILSKFLMKVPHNFQQSLKFV